MALCFNDHNGNQVGGLTYEATYNPTTGTYPTGTWQLSGVSVAGYAQTPTVRWLSPNFTAGNGSGGGQLCASGTACPAEVEVAYYCYTPIGHIATSGSLSMTLTWTDGANYNGSVIRTFTTPTLDMTNNLTPQISGVVVALPTASGLNWTINWSNFSGESYAGCEVVLH